jgi:hypothetical protein
LPFLCDIDIADRLCRLPIEDLYIQEIEKNWKLNNSFAKYLLVVDDSGTWKSSLDIVDLSIYLKIET